MPHEDGAAYEPVVATVSLGSSTCLEITRKPGTSEGEEEDGKGREGEGEGEGGKEATPLPARIFQAPRSLLVTLDPAYSSTLHGISRLTSDTHLSSSTVANWNLLDAGARSEVGRKGGVSERGTRVSLTYRDVRRVSGAVGKVLGRRAV